MIRLVITKCNLYIPGNKTILQSRALHAWHPAKQHSALRFPILPSFYLKKITPYIIIILQSKVITQIHSTFRISPFNRQCSFYWFVCLKLGRRLLRFEFFQLEKLQQGQQPTACGKCYLASRKSGPWDDSMKMESSTELTACTWWVILPSSSANSMAPHSATRALNLLYTCTQFAVHSRAHKRRLKITSLN